MEPPHSQPFSSPKYKILIVDDELNARNSIKRVLENSGFDTVSFSDGTTVLDFLEKSSEEVSVIISDYRMPGMNGLDLLSSASRKWPFIQRILLTAFMDQLSLKDVVNEAKIFRFIEKPFNNEELISITREASSVYTRLIDQSPDDISNNGDLYRLLGMLLSSMQKDTPLIRNLPMNIQSLLKKQDTTGNTDWDFHLRVSEKALEILNYTGNSNDLKSITLWAAMIYGYHIRKNPSEYTEDFLKMIDEKITDKFGKVIPVKNFDDVINAISHMSENFDGSGTPDGLSGDRIPLVSRILSIAHYYVTLLDSEGGIPFIVDFFKWNAGKIHDPSLIKILIETA